MEDAQQAMMEMQEVQQNLQQVVQQSQETENELNGVRKALDELEGNDEGQVYRAVGDLMVARDRDSLEEELSEKKEDLQVRLKSLEKKEDKLREKLQETQSKITQGMQG